MTSPVVAVFARVGAGDTDTPRMTAIRAKCPSCGVVDLSPADISLHLHPSGPLGSYRFVCPVCDEEVDKRADRRTVELLLAAGVEPGPKQPAVFEPPLPFEDWSPDPLAAPFTLDDVIEFHFLLESDGAISQLLSV